MLCAGLERIEACAPKDGERVAQPHVISHSHRGQLPLAESAGHRPPLAALLVALGSLERKAGEGKAAEVTLKRAMQEALASNDRESIALA